MRRPTIILSVATALVLLWSGIASAIPNPDPCDAKYTANTIAALKSYDKCRLDRIEAKVDALGQVAPSPTPTVSPSSTPSPTRSSTPTTTPTPTPSVSATPTTSATPTPTVTPTPTATTVAGWPGPANTGVPAGTTLTPISGDIVWSSGTHNYDAKQINGRVVATGSAVINITRSKINGRVDSDSITTGRINLTDVEVDAGDWQGSALGFGWLTLLRVNVHGAHAVSQCHDCTITDSWLHSPYLGNTADHLGAWASFGGGHVILRHNYINCDTPSNSLGGGCSGSAQIYGDFGPQDAFTDYLFDGNLFGDSSDGYCTSFGDNGTGKPYHATNVRVINNVWQYHLKNGKPWCGYWGTTTSMPDDAASVWSNNTYADGTPVVRAGR